MRSILVIIVAITIVLTTISCASAMSVQFYQKNAYGKWEKVSFVAPNTPYLAVVNISSPTDRIVTIQVRADVPFWFDRVLSEKMVKLHTGFNTIKIPFILNIPADKPPSVRGVFVRISGILDIQSVDQRFACGDEIRTSGFYFAGLRLIVNGNDYDVDAFAPIPSYSSVIVSGKLIGEDGVGVSGYKVVAYWILNYEKSATTTGGHGAFILTWTAPNWKDLGLCGSKIRLCKVVAYDPNTGVVLTSWYVTGLADCTVSRQPKLAILSLELDPPYAKLGQEVTIKATILNNGTSTVKTKVILIVDNYRLDKVYDITLSPGEKITLTWDYEFLYSGEHVITVVAGSSIKSERIYIGTSTSIPNVSGVVRITNVSGYILGAMGLLCLAYIIVRVVR